MSACQCGCGMPAPVAASTGKGYQKGESKRFIQGCPGGVVVSRVSQPFTHLRRPGRRVVCDWCGWATRNSPGGRALMAAHIRSQHYRSAP